jgi:hypothetical protein
MSSLTERGVSRCHAATSASSLDFSSPGVAPNAGGERRAKRASVLAVRSSAVLDAGPDRDSTPVPHTGTPSGNAL